MGHIRNYYICNCCGKWFHKSRGYHREDDEFTFCSGPCLDHAIYKAEQERDCGGGFEPDYWIEDESFRKMKNTFTPINIAWVEDICEGFGLVRDNLFDYNNEKERDYRGAFGNIGCTEIFWDYKDYGIDQASANYWPVVSIYKSDKGRTMIILNENPYFVHEKAADGKDSNYIEPGGRFHSIGSVERFRKYLKQSIKQFEAVRKEYEDFTGQKYPVGDKKEYGF